MKLKEVIFFVNFCHNNSYYVCIKQLFLKTFLLYLFTYLILNGLKITIFNFVS